MSAPTAPTPPPSSPTEPPPEARRGRFAHLYGAQPWNLLSLLACFLVTGYAVSRLLDQLPVLVRIAIWFVGSAVVWDLVLGPLLALGDAALRKVRFGPVPPLNYLRFPAMLSLLLLLVFAPLILQRSEEIFRKKAGLTQDPYLERWLAVTIVLFAASAVLYALAVRRARRRQGSAEG